MPWSLFHGSCTTVSARLLALFESGKHDLVITDFKMSNMDGLELAEAIKKCSQSTTVILLTDHVEAITAAGGPVSNVDIVLRKVG
jgi:CheY-like chemotaxis protein